MQGTGWITLLQNPGGLNNGGKEMKATTVLRIMALIGLPISVGIYAESITAGLIVFFCFCTFMGFFGSVHD